MSSNIKIQLLNIIDFVIYISSYKNFVCEVGLRIKVVIILTGCSSSNGFFGCLVSCLLSLFSFFNNFFIFKLSFESLQVTIPNVLFFFYTVKALFIYSRFLKLLTIISFLLYYYCQISALVSDLFCHIDYFNKSDNLLDLLQIFLVGI